MLPLSAPTCSSLLQASARRLGLNHTSHPAHIYTRHAPTLFVACLPFLPAAACNLPAEAPGRCVWYSSTCRCPCWTAGAQHASCEPSTAAPSPSWCAQQRTFPPQHSRGAAVQYSSMRWTVVQTSASVSPCAPRSSQQPCRHCMSCQHTMPTLAHAQAHAQV